MRSSILITGCSPGGIGYATAHALKARGYRVFATARHIEVVEQLKEEGFDAYRLDVTDIHSMEKAVEHLLKVTGGTLDALFNNAGYGQPGAVEDISTETLREQFETNVFGLHELTRRVTPIMRRQGHGRIIQHSSVLGLISLRFRGAYNASKYAIEGLCDTLRLELMNTNIHVSTLNTGPVRSKFRENATKMFFKHIDMEHSVYKDEYKSEVLQHEDKKESNDLFTRNPDVVIKAVIHALESPRPKPRYYITGATHLLGTFKRLLSTRLLDKLLRKVQ
ncbi:MAG: SDR family NAD(P)-dependent oxidoreductase [Campylobacterota bacterium]|nr:SDR family NAD(P)-dependent oxidoreductase [Campylobacterota bacterium]